MSKVQVEGLLARTGDLRDFLAESMVQVRKGELTIERASQITKLAGQINESFYSEIKIARIRKDFEFSIHPLGDLPLSASETKRP